METERRDQHRFSLARMVAYDIGRDQYIRAQGTDISRGGMAFTSAEYVNPMLSVWVSFSIPGVDGSWRQLEAEGYVVNVIDLSPGCRFGVSFVRMSHEDRNMLNEFITRLELENNDTSTSDNVIVDR